MHKHDHPFIDIAALDGVRERFLSGDALVLLSADLESIVWANGPGAELFGFDGVEDARSAGSGLSFAARRQIEATPGFPNIGFERPMSVRLAQGVVQLLGSTVYLPDAEPAVLLALPAAEPSVERAISGIARPGCAAALFDADGKVHAASEGFAAMGIDADTLRDTARRIASEADRLLKKPVVAGGASYPAGVVRISDFPARMLIIVVDDPRRAEPDATPSPRPTRTQPPPDDWVFTDTARARHAPLAEPVSAVSEPEVDRAPTADAEPAGLRKDEPAGDDRAPMQADTDVPVDAPEPLEPTLAEMPVAAETVAAAPAEPEPDVEPVSVTRKPDQSPTAAEPAEIQTDAPSSTGSGDVLHEADPAPGMEPDPAAGPVRFVWRTDAEGRFSVVSDTLAAAVGSASADIVGRSFEEVASTLRLDPDGEIAALLRRRDTWSGRTVLWPVDGTDLRVPVDLAALPVYARDRSFEGFRGFGVARVGDAVVDPEPPSLNFPSFVERAGQARPDDPFKGEPAALAVDDAPARRASDNVVRLAAPRAGQDSGDRSLTDSEASAFREIGERLRERDQARSGAASEAPPAAPAPLAREEADWKEFVGDVGARLDEVARQLDSLLGEAAAAGRPVPDAPSAVPAPTPPAPPQDAVPPSVPQHAEDDREPHGAPPAADASAGEAFGEEPMERQPPAGVDTSILSRLPVPVLIHAGDRLHYANGEFLDLTGYLSLPELEAAGGLDAIFVDAATTDPDDHRRRLRTRDGAEFPVEATLQSVPWQGGKALLLAIRPSPPQPVEAPPAPVANIAPVKPEALAELESRVAEMSAIVDTATDGIVIITRDGMIRSISRPAEALFGFDSAEVAGRPFASLFAVESQRAARDYLAGLSDNGVASVLNDGREVIGREAQGRFIPLFMTIGRLPGDNGYCAVLRDITQWKRAEEELTQARAEAERASSQKTDFLARISHEIRTPLNAIIGFSELMIDEKFGPIVNERYRDYLRDINRSGNHVLDLVNDLLDISKIEAGEQEMSYEAVSLNEVLAESVAMMQPQANRNKVIIRSSFGSRLPEVVADQRSVRQIALNLLSNAVRYTQAGGQVIVSTSYEPSGDIVMRVRDTGVGMSVSEIEQALKPFKQVNALKRHRGDGTGLGLPLTKAMVEANRARFLIHSTPGEGTLVEVVFPSTRVLAS